MKNKIIKVLIVVFASTSFVGLNATIRYASTNSELTTAINNSATAGDEIQITADIVIQNEITISKSITINGNRHTISVPNPGLDDMGRFNLSASAFRAFTISGSVSVDINQTTIKGGAITSGTGGAIEVTAGSTLRLDGCLICNSRNSAVVSGGGGGLSNSGTTYLRNSLIIRNAASYGGGFLNMGVMYLESSTLSENRSTSSSGGGGAGENQDSLFINNSTISNNQSTEIGGGINNKGGVVYIANSSVTGNVAFGSLTFKGGGIGNNGGYVFAINSLFAHNYHISAGTVSNPTAYELDDLTAYIGQTQISLYYCIYHANLPLTTRNIIGNIQYTGLQNGSNNTIFSGGTLSKITNGTGSEIGTAMVYKPFLYNNNGQVAPTLKTGSFLLTNKGAQTRYSTNGNSVIAYYDMVNEIWVDLKDSSNVTLPDPMDQIRRKAKSDYELVTVDQTGANRAFPPTVGAVENATSETLYMLKVNSAANGTVNGGTIYGDVYPDGTSVTITAIPYSDYSFIRWDYVTGGSGTASTTNPYTFTVNRDITLIPVFQSNAVGTYTITYIGNDNSSGEAPSSATFNTPTTIAGRNALQKDGLSFVGWNTNANGSGTNYAVGASYSAGTNLTLYAKWQENTWTGNTSTNWSTATNWSAGFVPTALDNATIPDVTNNPIVNESISTPATCYEMKINQGGVVSIEAGKSLIVTTTITNNAGASALIVKSNASSQGGTLIFHNAVDNPVSATVQMYSKAKWNLNNPAGSKYKWQFFGIPVSSLSYSNSFSNCYVREWDETVKLDINLWVRRNNGTSLTLANGSVLTSGKAYEIVQQAEKIYSFAGELVNEEFSRTLSYTSDAVYPGQNIIANPYTAAIDIKEIVFGNNTENAVYQYNAGTYNEWGSNNGESNPGDGTTITPGQYSVSTPFTAGSLGILSEIPSMQGFMVKATANAGQITIPYSTVKPIELQQRVKSAEKPAMRIDLKGTTMSDCMWIFIDPSCSANFDNGYDGRKLLSSIETAQLFAIEPDDNYQIDAVNDLNVTKLGFQPGKDTKFTLTFSNQNLDKFYGIIYLVDLVDNKTIDITGSGIVYTFNAVASTNISERFKIVTKPTDFKQIKDVKLVNISIGGSLLNIRSNSSQSVNITLCNSSGIIVFNEKLSAYETKSLSTSELTPGIYFATTICNSERTVERIIINK